MTLDPWGRECDGRVSQSQHWKKKGRLQRPAEACRFWGQHHCCETQHSQTQECSLSLSHMHTHSKQCCIKTHKGNTKTIQYVLEELIPWFLPQHSLTPSKVPMQSNRGTFFYGLIYFNIVTLEPVSKTLMFTQPHSLPLELTSERYSQRQWDICVCVCAMSWLLH